MRAQLATMRIKKDLAELSGARFSCEHASTAIELPEGQSDLLKIKVTVSMTCGAYAGGHFPFMIDVPTTYPFHAPSVTSISRVWHPNIELQSGKVLHPLFEKDWRPVLSINTVIFGLQLLFVEPNPEYPANKLATGAFCSNRELFNTQVHQILRGGTWFGLEFPCHAALADPLSRTVQCKRRGGWHGSGGGGGGGGGGGAEDCGEWSADSTLDLETMCLDGCSDLDTKSRPCKRRRGAAPPSPSDALGGGVGAAHVHAHAVP